MSELPDWAKDNNGTMACSICGTRQSVLNKVCVGCCKHPSLMITKLDAMEEKVTKAVGALCGIEAYLETIAGCVDYTNPLFLKMRIGHIFDDTDS